MVHVVERLQRRALGQTSGMKALDEAVVGVSVDVLLQARPKPSTSSRSADSRYVAASRAADLPKATSTGAYGGTVSTRHRWLQARRRPSAGTSAPSPRPGPGRPGNRLPREDRRRSDHIEPQHRRVAGVLSASAGVSQADERHVVVSARTGMPNAGRNLRSKRLLVAVQPAAVADGAVESADYRFRVIAAVATGLHLGPLSHEGDTTAESGGRAPRIRQPLEDGQRVRCLRLSCSPGRRSGRRAGQSRAAR